MSDLYYQRGRLSYRRKSTGLERGREDWWLTRNRDGSTTLRTLSVTDDSEFVRDVVYTRRADGRPLDALIRLQVADQLIGLGLLRLEGTELLVQAFGQTTGAVTQRISLPADYCSITTHAVMLDGWLYFNYDHAQGGPQVRTVYNTSTQWNGTDGPLGRLDQFRLKMLGQEALTVPAGTFTATHFTVEATAAPVHTAHLWVTGADCILLRYDWPDLDLEYVLTEWQQA